MYTTRTYETPFGISVYGSAIIQTEPDIVTIICAVSSLDVKPREAFKKVKEDISKLRQFLSTAEVSDVSSSRTSLSQAFQFVGGTRKFIGYEAKTNFRIMFHDLDRVEEILSGIVEAGVNEISSTEFQTTHLKELRAEARKQALRAAREKAEVYSNAADIKIGAVIHIEDLNPDQPTRGEGHAPLARGDDEEEMNIFEPGKITIQAAVMVAFSIEKK